MLVLFHRFGGLGALILPNTISLSWVFKSFLYPQGVSGTVSWSCPEFCGRRGHACSYFLSFIMSDYSSAHPCPLSSIPDTLLMLGLCWRWVALYLLFDLLSISLLTFLFCLCQSLHFVPDFLVYGHSCLFSPGLGIIFFTSFTLLSAPSLKTLLIHISKLLNPSLTTLQFPVFWDLVIKKLKFRWGHASLLCHISFLFPVWQFAHVLVRTDLFQFYLEILVMSLFLKIPSPALREKRIHYSP